MNKYVKCPCSTTLEDTLCTRFGCYVCGATREEAHGRRIRAELASMITLIIDKNNDQSTRLIKAIRAVIANYDIVTNAALIVLGRILSSQTMQPDIVGTAKDSLRKMAEDFNKIAEERRLRGTIDEIKVE